MRFWMKSTDFVVVLDTELFYPYVFFPISLCRALFVYNCVTIVFRRHKCMCNVNGFICITSSGLQLICVFFSIVVCILAVMLS